MKIASNLRIESQVSLREDKDECQPYFAFVDQRERGKVRLTLSRNIDQSARLGERSSIITINLKHEDAAKLASELILQLAKVLKASPPKIDG